MLAVYAMAILLPSSLICGFLHREQFLGVLFLTLLLWVVLVLVATDGEKLLLRSVAIRHQRDRLVRDLEQRNADVRAAMAKAANQPAYVIFPDRTLIEMSKQKPKSLAQLSAIHGVGETKLQKYGPAFLAVIKDHA